MLPQTTKKKSNSTHNFLLLLLLLPLFFPPSLNPNFFPNIPVVDNKVVVIPKPSIPHPKNSSSLPQSNPSNVKKIVQFKPPITPNSHHDKDDEKERRRRRESECLAQVPSVKSLLSSIPAPRNSTTLGVTPSAGSGRRSIIETQVPTSTLAPFEDKNEASVSQSAPNYSNYKFGTDANAGNAMNYTSYVNYQWSTDQNSGNYGSYDLVCDQILSNYPNYANYSSYQASDPNADVATNYGSYGNYHGQYENNWGDGSVAATLPETSGMAEIGVKVKGKRGRHELPAEIVEVKQDELLKNRPRENKFKVTGIAFGPSYQIAQTIQIPFSKAEDIIGIGGPNIACIRRSSGAIITVQDSMGLSDEITVEIKGISSQLQWAQQLIEEFMGNYKDPVTSSGYKETSYRSSFSQLGSTSSSLSTQPYGGGYGGSSSSVVGGYSTFRL